MLIQHAAICVRRDADGDKVLLVTSMDTGRWIPPKGHPEPGLSGGEVAQAEALEEAGVIGNVTGRGITVDQIFAGVMRFLAMDIVVLGILILVPAISTVIPNGL